MMETTMKNSVSRLMILFVSYVLVSGIAAQGQTPPDPPHFFLETITVENTESVSPEIVISESLLGQGISYTESQLRDAVHRITRLPFILDADFRLEKGSARNAYELVITVRETRKWFFGLDGVVTWRDEPSRFNDEGELDLTQSLVGRRFSIGKYGVLFAALAGEDEVLSLGYTHYNLADRGIILDLSYALDSFSSFSDSHRLESRVIVPLRTNQSLRFAGIYFLERDRRDPRITDTQFLDFGDRQAWLAEAAWTHNSLDDPIFPTSGLLLEGSLSHSRTTQNFDSRFFLDDGEVIEDRGTSVSENSTARLQAQKHWPVTRRQTLSSGVTTSFFHSEVSNRLTEPRNLQSDAWRTEISFGHAMFLLRQNRKDLWRELRWETEVEVALRDQNTFQGNNFNSGVVSTGLAYRNRWGVFRLVAQYQDFVL